MIQGVDVFEGYGDINWEVAAASGLEFAYIKCTEGNAGGKDPAFDRNVRGARAAGIAVGAYHFAYPLPPHPDHPGRPPREQAQAAFKGCFALGADPGELSPAVDAEWPLLSAVELAKWGCSVSHISEWLHEYCEAATLLWGRLPVIYTFPDWWRGEGSAYRGLSAADVSWARAYPLWMATYSHPGPGTPTSGAPAVPAPWEDWAVWQYSAKGSSERIPGIAACPIDRDCIRDRAAFLALTGRKLADPYDTDEVTKPSMSAPVVTVHPVVPLLDPIDD